MGANNWVVLMRQSNKVLRLVLWSSSVMLDKVLDDELKSVGLARSLTSNIQKLRKDTGISIDDEIEVFYEFGGESNENSVLGKVVVGNTDKIAF